jgi:hypothetical protein
MERRMEEKAVIHTSRDDVLVADERCPRVTIQP